MEYRHLARQDRAALDWYIDCLKKVTNMNIDYEIYKSPSLYIIYLDDNIFDVLEDKIDDILDYNHKFLTIDREILFSPKRFMVSCEEKIENYPNFIQYNINAESNCHQNLFTFDFKMKDTKNFDIINHNFSGLYTNISKTKGDSNGCAA